MQSYDDKKPSKYIMYLDEINLYGWAMSQYLPYGEFHWLNQKEINKFCLKSGSENGSDRYILEVDLKYLEELHELHNDYPLAPEKLEISHNMLSNYCSSIANNYDIKIRGVNKLDQNLGNKSKHVLHYKHLQLHFSSRIKLTKIYKILKFK